MKIKNLAVRYIHLEAESEEAQRKLEGAFDVLFESIWTAEVETLPYPLASQYLRISNVSTNLKGVQS